MPLDAYAEKSEYGDFRAVIVNRQTQPLQQFAVKSRHFLHIEIL
jgi:hypothetical protein